MGHVHDEATIQKIVHRLSRVIGHLESVKKMLQDGEDCGAVLIQLAAVRSAVSGAGKELLKHHLDHCIVEAVKAHDESALAELSSAIDRFMK